MPTSEAGAARKNGRKQIAAARGEVTSDRPRNKTLIWQGVELTLPAELGAALMFDVLEAQVGDDAALMRGIGELLGTEQRARCRKAAVDQNLPTDAFNDLVAAVLGEYGLGPGELSASAVSSGNGSTS